MKHNWDFLGEGGCKTKNLPWGSMDIFWNYTFAVFVESLVYLLPVANCVKLHPHKASLL